MKEERAYNSEMANAYEVNARISLPSYDAIFTMVQSYFRLQLGDKSAEVLAVGIGSGTELSAWGPSNPKWTITGIDPNLEMLKIAKNKTFELGLESRVKLIHGTIEDLPLQDAKFDAASCILVLHFINDVQEKVNLLKTIKANLKSGAPFVLVSAYGDRDDAELQDRMNVWKSFWLDNGRDLSTVDGMIIKAIQQLSFISENHIIQLLAEAGFTNITRFYSTGIMAGWICHAGDH
ncbi:class I SAM-dependent methyltransferase [Paenibacillus sp. GSMTC-2017]|uniref:class I SAM-dependent methyltransferase n=1 Tax=Paenibacillus sp. GSMTC-2017 TaxID=2794350 RepID=UPI0018D7A034|nr:class I SAM-dependent methyltransferase [Paenibacillus sp. GSMTC-2017]MBH5318753.1 class I SAM-dependent methyltransferase [Paenibacillus sp. GSMTC-2017]